MVDLRSDTVTKPSPGMRAAIANAEVDDDTLGADPTTARLEAAIAELLGKEAAAFFPSGIMANETALLVLTRPGTEVICEATCHFFDWEVGAASAWAGVQLRGVRTPDGRLNAELAEQAIRPAFRLQLRTSAICVENTHAASGGTVLSVEAMRGIAEVASRHKLPMHLDGSRLWHAATALGVAEKELAKGADTVMVTMSKGLGCPVGSLLAGAADRIEQARVVRRRLGGGLRQSGILAAAGLYALEHNRSRLAEDHARAKRLADRAAAIPALRVIPPETNILMIDIVKPGTTAADAIAALAKRDVHFVEISSTRIRAVTHLDVDDAGIDTAVAALHEVFA